MTQQSTPNLLMLSGDRDVSRGRKGPFYYTLAALRRYWQRIDVIVPPQPDAAPQQPFPNVFIHPSGGGKLSRARCIAQRADTLLQERKNMLSSSATTTASSTTDAPRPG